jgi:transmembrane sensor
MPCAASGFRFGQNNYLLTIWYICFSRLSSNYTAVKNLNVDEQYLLTLLLKYEAGDCTEAEKALVEQWYDRLGGGVRESRIKVTHAEVLRDRIWSGVEPSLAAYADEQVSNHGVRRLDSRRRRLAYALSAAAVLGFVMLSVWWWKGRPFSGMASVLAISTDKGQVKKVALPDGSLVWLNGASVIRFIEDSAHIRLLLLDEGEAYCEVARDGDRPFVVRTPSGVTIKVLGTAFTVKAYRQMGEEKVEVLSGRVRVDKSGRSYGELGRGQAAIIDRAGETGRTTQADSAEADGWTRGKIRLDNVAFSELSVALENTFNVTVRSRDAGIAGKRCTIAFSRSDDVLQLLDVLKKIYKINYSMDQPTRTITIDKTQ